MQHRLGSRTYSWFVFFLVDDPIGVLDEVAVRRVRAEVVKAFIAACRHRRAFDP